MIRSDRVHGQIRVVALFDEEVVAAVARGHACAQQQSISLEMFCREPLVLFLEGCFLREAVSQYRRKHNQALDIRFETHLVELLKSLVINGV